MPMHEGHACVGLPRPLIVDLANCTSTDSGAQPRLVSLQEGEAPYYSAPCDDAPGAVNGTLPKCDSVEYLGVKTVSSCGDGLCYAKVRVRSSTIAWVPDHTLGFDEAFLGPPSACIIGDLGLEGAHSHAWGGGKA